MWLRSVILSVAAALICGPVAGQSTYWCRNPETGECKMVGGLFGGECTAPWKRDLIGQCAAVPTPTPTPSPTPTPGPGPTPTPIPSTQRVGLARASAVQAGDLEIPQDDMLQGGKPGMALLPISITVDAPSVALACVSLRWLAHDPMTAIGDRVAYLTLDGEDVGVLLIDDMTPGSVWQTSASGCYSADLSPGVHLWGLRAGGCCYIEGHPWVLGAGSRLDVIWSDAARPVAVLPVLTVPDAVYPWDGVGMLHVSGDCAAPPCELYVGATRLHEVETDGPVSWQVQHTGPGDATVRLTGCSLPAAYAARDGVAMALLPRRAGP